MNSQKRNDFILSKRKICKNCWLKSYYGQPKTINAYCSRKLINKSVRFNKGEHLIMSGATIQGIYCIREGTVKIYKRGNNNKEYIFWLAGKGEIVGLDSFLNTDSFFFSVSAICNVTACYISVSNMNKLIVEQPNIIEGLMQNICSKINFMESRITNISNRRKKEEIADFLLLLIKQNIDKTVNSVSINYSIADIGNLMGISRSYVNKVLHDFQKLAILEINRKEITIHDINALAGAGETIKNIIIKSHNAETGY